MKKTALLLGLCSFLMFGCQKDEVEEEENELITTVKLNFTEGGKTQTFAYKDLDGDGGTTPTIETIKLLPNKTYSLTIEVLNESVSPVVNITKEVEAEKDEHLFVFTPSPAGLITYTYGDKDSRNFPIGITGSAKTGSVSTGKLKVQLRHQPPANSKPTKDGTPTPGSDDINIDFNVQVQ